MMQVPCPYCSHITEVSGQDDDLVRCSACAKPFEVDAVTSQEVIRRNPLSAAEKEALKQQARQRMREETVQMSPIQTSITLEDAAEENRFAEHWRNAGLAGKIWLLLAYPFALLVSNFKVFMGVIGLVAILGVVMLDVFSGPVEKTHEQKVRALFSEWDGSNAQIVAETKKRMKDPASFEHIGTRFSDRGDHVVIIMTFRGKNSFGGIATQQAMGIVDMPSKKLRDLTIK